MKTAEIGGVPAKVYVFPPMRIDPNGRPLEALQHRITTTGVLIWDSPTPRAAEVKSVVEQALRKHGFLIVEFEALTTASRSQEVLVVNPYFTKRLNVKDTESVGRIFVRLTGSTFPDDMNPAGKIDRFNQEAIVFFDRSLGGLDVVKRVLSNLVKNIGRNLQWQDRLHILTDA